LNKTVKHIAVADGTSFGGAISGIYNHTTGLNVNPKITLKNIIRIIPIVKPGYHFQ
jgi:hypothetical protein